MNDATCTAEVGNGPQTLRLRGGLVVFGEGLQPAESAVRLVLNSRVLRLEGEDSRRLLGLLDGTRTLDDVCDAMQDFSREDVSAAVDALRQHSLLEPTLDAAALDAAPEVVEHFAPQLRAFIDLGVSGAAVFTALNTGSALVVGPEPIAASMHDALTRYGLGSVTALPVGGRAALDAAADDAFAAADVVVVCVDVETPKLLDSVNAAALRTRRPWLLLGTSGFKVRVGPFFWPGQTACYACYTRRLEANALHYDDRKAIRLALLEPGAPVPAADNVVPGIAAIGASLAAVEVLKFFCSRVAPMQPSLYGRFLDFSPLGMEGTTHRVLKLPRCPACGVRAQGEPTVRAWMEPYDYRISN